MPCCANNTTAHVRDISFYYYPSVRSLALSTSSLSPASSLLPVSLLRSCSCWIPRFLLPQPFFLLPPALLLFLLSSLSFCSATARVSRCAIPLAAPLLLPFLFVTEIGYESRIEEFAWKSCVYPFEYFSWVRKNWRRGKGFLPLFHLVGCWAPSGSIYNAHALVLEMATSYEEGTTCVKSHYTRNDT